MRSRHVAVLLSIGAIACKDLPTASNRFADRQPPGGVSSSASVSSVAILDLGTLQAGTPATARDINNSGYVVGFSGHFPTYCCGDIVNQPHGFLWTQVSGMRDIGVSMRAYGGGINSTATTINNAGLIAGNAREAYFDNVHYLITGQASDILTSPSWNHFPYPPALWSMTIQGLFAPVPTQITTALDVNSAGVTVGTGDDGLTGAFVWSASAGFTTLATLGPGRSAATGINDAGQIVGWGTIAGLSRPFRWAPSTLAVENIGLPSGWISGRATGVNATGSIVGFGRDASGRDRGFVWDPVTHAFTELGTLGGTHSYAYAINVDGVVVGASTTMSGALHAFAWDPISAEMVDLGALPGDTQGEALAVNDHGQVVGRSFGAGVDHAVLWTVTFQHDNTPPTIGADVIGTPGTNGWFTSDVTVSWTVIDNESDVASTTGCTTSTLATDAASQTYTCSATSNVGLSASESVTVKRDATVPSVGYSAHPAEYSVDQAVAITCSASDALSGLASSTCANVVGDAYTFQLGTNAFTATALDGAGNSSDAATSFTVTVTSVSLCALTTRFVENTGVANSLCVKLDNSAKSYAKGNAQAAQGQLTAYVNEVSAQTGLSISAANAATLTALANAM